MGARFVRVEFAPSGKHGEFAAGTSVLDAARQLEVDVASACGGRGLCGRCQVRLAAPPGAPEPAPLEEPSAAERELRAQGLVPEGVRLACQARVRADVRLFVEPADAATPALVRKAASATRLRVDPALRLCTVALRAEGRAADRAWAGAGTPGLWAALQRALAREGDANPARIDLVALQELPQALRQGGGTVTVAIHESGDAVAVWPGRVTQAYGAAIDVGTTTVAAHLCDLTSGETLASAGVMNPQIRFGDDVMSRIAAAMLQPQARARMTGAIRAALAALVQDLARAAAIDPSRILDVTVVGNPAMHHLLLGIDPAGLGVAPFAPVTTAALRLRAAELELGLHPGARVYVLPCIAGHVGADAAAVLLAERPDERDEVSLVVDVGTNAEIILGNRGRVLACSSPTGPAFEGAQIADGQRAAPGAIERVRIDPATGSARVKIIGCDAWSDEPGFDAAAVTGICGSGIVEAVAEMRMAGILAPDGTIDGALARGNPLVQADGRTFSYTLLPGREGGRAVRLRQADVRAIQLAKAALYASVRLLMDAMGVTRVARIRLAGAFGSHIDAFHAMAIGMIPDCPLEQVSSAGNAAGTGARIALLDRGARAELEQLVARVEKIETALQPSFQERFVAAMSLPHASDAFTQLALRLPAVPAVPAPGRRGPARARARADSRQSRQAP